MDVHTRAGCTCREQQVEFSVISVLSGAVGRFLIEEKELATVTADGRGRASAQRTLAMPR